MRFFKYLKRLLEARTAKLSRENAKRAKEAADKLFPGEKWIKVENGIYLSPRRAVGSKTNYNVFLNLEESPLNRREIINALYRARNSSDYAEKSKNFPEGKIILKINGSDSLIYLNVNRLKVSR